VHTGDARKLPSLTPASTLLLSSMALPTIYNAGGGRPPCAKIARVLAPGGRVLIVSCGTRRNTLALCATQADGMRAAWQGVVSYHADLDHVRSVGWGYVFGSRVIGQQIVID